MCKHYSNWVKPSLQKLTYISLLELQFCANPSANLLQNVIYLLQQAGSLSVVLPIQEKIMKAHFHFTALKDSFQVYI